MLNQVMLIGNAGATPQLRRTNDQAVATLQLATHRSWKDREGQRKEDTQWHSLVFWGPLAESAAKVLDKGQLLLIDGRLKHSSWPDRDDPEKTHYRTEVVVNRFRILSPKAPGSAPPATAEAAQSPS
ncbi:MAG: single-stranded DNA-binding protein [bacterium]|nr:single-stranded DNA-binding protein [bacterium]